MTTALASPAGPDGGDALRTAVAVVLEALSAGVAARGGPVPAGGSAAVADRTRQALGTRPGDAGLLPEHGIGARAALAGLTEALAAGAADPADPRCAAHLHCPPLAVAVAADLAVSALNPSLDSWDQAPSATTVEAEVLATLAGLVGFDPARAAGTMTTGGTASNLTGLLLAREAAAACQPGARLRVFCSEVAHFSVRRGARLLGLTAAGDSAADDIVTVGCDDRHRMDPAALSRALAAYDGPAVIVATAGTTDAGAIDPLLAVAEVVRARRPAGGGPSGGQPDGGWPNGGWLHVDAAYGGGALLSDRLRGLLDGIAEADSVALDLHKLGWQPVPAGAVLTPDDRPWRRLDTEVAYLNPADDSEAGFTSLVGRSLQTTRRSDAFAVAVTFRALGRRRLGALVDACHDLARQAADSVARRPELVLALPVTLTSVVFRYLPPDDGADGVDADWVNALLRRRLMTSGGGLVGRTELGPTGAVHLKLTLLNPHATIADVEALLDLVVATGAEVCREAAVPRRPAAGPGEAHR